MKSLLLKDLYNISYNVKYTLVVLIFLGLVFVPTSGPIPYMAMCAVFCSLMIFTTFTLDNACGWTSYALVLPVSRSRLVLAKYAALAVFCTVGILFGLAASSLGSYLIFGGVPGPVEMLVGGMLPGWAMAFAMGSTIIPLVYRFGTEKARILFYAVCIIPVLAALIVAVLLTKTSLAAVASAVLPYSVRIVLCSASPLAALAWGAVMYRVACGVFAKAEC